MKNTSVPAKRLQRDWLRVAGPDALRFLMGMWTCDFKRASVRSTGHGYLLNVKGKTVGEGVFLADEDGSFVFSVSAGSGRTVFEALDHYLVADQVELRELSGVSAFKDVFALIDTSFEPGASALEVAQTVPGSRDRVFSARKESWGWRIPRGLLGPRHEEWWIFQGCEAPSPLSEISDEDWTRARIEAGQPEWGRDLGPDQLILEFPAAASISFTKGCYLGQEVVARATYRGHMNRGFCRFSGEADLAQGFVFAESAPDQPVGKITSAAGTRGLGLARLGALQEELFQKDAAGGRVAIKRAELLIAAGADSKDS